jgi:hypothetical protein
MRNEQRQHVCAACHYGIRWLEVLAQFSLLDERARKNKGILQAVYLPKCDVEKGIAEIGPLGLVLAAERRMLGIVHRAAIKLDPAADELVIGEGIETGMAARQLGLRPVWVLGSVGAISFFPTIDGVKQLIILGEIGEPSARAIKLCGTRWRRVGRRVRIVMPSDGLSDMNDALIAERSFS